MIIWLYFFSFLLTFAITTSLLLSHKRILTSIVLLGSLVTFASLGRFLMAISQSWELAYFGLILMQIAASYCPIVIILILAEMCHIKLFKSVVFLLTAIGTVVFVLMLPFPDFDLYYASTKLVQRHGCSFLQREFGPLHFLYPLMLVEYMVTFIWLLLAALKKNRKAHISTVAVTVLFVLLIMGLYLIDYLTVKITNLALHGFFVSMLLLLWRMERANMYDLSSNISASIEALDENGYIEFDRSYRCTGVNGRIRRLFPEIDDRWRLNKKIPQYDSFLYREVILWMYTRKENEKKTILVNDRYYELIVRPIPYLHQKCVGYLLALVDRTSEIKYMNAVESYKTDLEREVDRQTEHISAMRDSLVLGMASMVESRDDSTGNHIKRTYAVMQVYAEKLKKHKKELGVTDEFLDMVTRAAPMHDLGKIAVDDVVLKKQSRFTPEDFELMKVHPAEGAKIVRNILTGVEDSEFVRIAENVAHYHHEKWDGTGYPDGLKGEEIPLEARIMALPDVFDALASKRRYKEPLPYDVVFPMIKGTLGSHFDPRLGQLFIDCRPQLEEMYRKWYEEDLDKEGLHLTPSIAGKVKISSAPER